MITMNNSVADNRISINGITYMVPDDIAYKVRDLVSGCKIDATSKEVGTDKPKAASGRAPKAYKDAGDYTVPYEVRKVGKKWGLGFTQRVPQTAFKAVADKVGTDWDKEHKVFWFATKKAAEDFMKSYPVALATDRKAVQDTYKKA